MKITRIRHLWPEPEGFYISRPIGAGEYIFLHFLNPVEILYKGEKIVTKPNSCIVFSPEEPQWFCSHMPLVHNWMHLTGEVGRNLSRYDLSTNTIYSLDDGEFITDIVRELEMEYNSDEKFYDFLCEIKLRELFIKIARSAEKPATSDINPEIEERFHKLRKEVFTSLEKGWSVPEMAQKVFLSEPYFYSLYKRLYGITPTQDLILARIDKAKSLLQQGFKVNEVATMTGYSAKYHFINQFRRIEGVSPGKYAGAFKK